MQNDNAKPISISKQLVYDAFLRVKANRGSAGIDTVSYTHLTLPTILRV